MAVSTQNQRQFASNFAYNKLRKKIIELEYAPSEQLTEVSLSEEIGISRTPLRQALYGLEMEQLVIKHPNGRLHVKPVTFEEAYEVFRVREVLEGMIAYDATSNFIPEKLNELRDVVDLIARAAKQDRKYDVIKYDADFHRIILSVSKNQTAKHFLEQLGNRIERYRRLNSYKNPTYTPTIAADDHQWIFTLIKNGNPSEVEEAMREHIRASLRSVIETLEIYFTHND